LISPTQLQEVPPRKSILLVGPPGAGKSVFCEQAVLQSLAMDRPIIYVTTELGASEVEKVLKEKGLGEIEPGLLNFIDAYNETVGLPVSDRPDTVRADCSNLSSLGIAISKLQDRIGKKGALLVFDSLTSPYLLSGPEVVRFMRLTLSRFAGEGNSVLACFDEGSGKEEDLVAMMSLSSGVIKMEVENGSRVLNVVKHPKVKPIRIEVPTTKIWEKIWMDRKGWDLETMRRFMKAQQSGALRREFGEGAVNVFWPNFAQWSGMLWDPKRFPRMTYKTLVEWGSYMREVIPLFPWHMRLLFKLFMPKNFSKVKDMKKLFKFFGGTLGEKGRRIGIMEYLDDVSKTDEHYFRVYESSECCGFENVGAAMASIIPPVIAGMCKGLEKEERDWNAVETKCIGLGDPYCEFKVVPGEIDELKGSLEKESSVVERIHERLMHRLMGFLIDEKPLVERPRLGSDSFFPFLFAALPAMSERYRMAWRMGGARAGKEVGERLMEMGIGEDEAVKRILNFLEHCKVGKVMANETIRIKQNCESFMTKYFTTKLEEPSCYFTTGFLNGFFSVVKNQHVKETRCIAMGDPYCEWEFK
jgi:predicted hydrocarbon binding protein/KaiC/GvpD/RAD55 family RecA-like ATPase